MPALIDFDTEATDTFFESETSDPVENITSSWIQRAAIRGALRVGNEALAVRFAILGGERDDSKLTNLIFFARHPERGGRRLQRGEPNFEQLAKEWVQIQRNLVRAQLAATQSRTPNGRSPTASSVGISPLAVAHDGLRQGRKRILPVFGICVHTTGSGPASRAKKNPRVSALQWALDYYIHGNEGFPHYVIGYDGTIVATCEERQVAWHAGWGGKGQRLYSNWQAPGWWSKVWAPQGFKTPLDLLPPRASDPNSASIGIELLADATGWGFTDAQYNALARLVVDIAKRHQLPITAAPSTRLLGHEDLHPIERSNKYGGWDPGAHRMPPKFSWQRLWTLITAIR